MALFEQKIWTDRQVQYPSRRKLTNVSTQEEKTVLVERNEGIVYNEGDLFDAININGLEERVADAFEEVEKFLDTRINLYYPIGKIYMSFNNTNPSELFPGTTWVQLKDHVLLPVDPSQESGQTGGSNTIKITPRGSIAVSGSAQTVYLSQTHMPVHNHGGVVSLEGTSPTRRFYRDIKYQKYGNLDGSSGGYDYEVVTTDAGNGAGHAHGFSGSATFTGIATTLDNKQKGITVYAWRRVG